MYVCREIIASCFFFFRENAEKARSGVAAAESRSCSRQSDAVTKTEGGGDTGELADIAEQPEAEVVSVH